MSPFWSIFPVFFQILTVSEWKKKEIGNVKNEKTTVYSRFHRNVARQVNFSLSCTIFCLLSWGRINGIPGAKWKGRKSNKELVPDVIRVKIVY